MKKLLSILLATMLIVCCFGMVGCGVSGKYELWAIEVDGEVYKDGDTIEVTIYGQKVAKEFDEWVKGYKEYNLDSLKLDKDGDARFLGYSDWEWEKDGKEITLESSGSSVELIKKGGKLRFDVSQFIEYFEEDVVFIYKKA